MAEITDFQLFHSYNQLVKEGKARPLVCLYDGQQYVVSHENGELRLVCYVCSSSVIPGLNTVANVTAVVKEHVL